MTAGRARLTLAALILAAGSVLYAALPASDNFNRGTVANLGGNWTTQTGSGGVTHSIVSDRASSNSAFGFNANYWSADAFANDQYAQVVFISFDSSGGDTLGPTVRASGTNKSYHFGAQNGLGRIYKWNSGYTSITSSITGSSPATNDVLKIDVVGTTITVYKNGTSLASATDATHTSGSAGLLTLNGFNGDTRYDDWMGDSIGGGGGPTCVPMMTLLGVGKC